jgi:hypothetical protein
MPAQTNTLRDPHLQNNQSKMDWRCGSSGRTPVLPAQSFEFKPQSYKKTKTKTKKYGYLNMLLEILFQC